MYEKRLVTIRTQLVEQALRLLQRRGEESLRSHGGWIKSLRPVNRSLTLQTLHKQMRITAAHRTPVVCVHTSSLVAMELAELFSVAMGVNRSSIADYSIERITHSELDHSGVGDILLLYSPHHHS